MPSIGFGWFYVSRERCSLTGKVGCTVCGKVRITELRRVLRARSILKYFTLNQEINAFFHPNIILIV